MTSKITFIKFICTKLTTTNHRNIGLMYFFSILFFFVLGSIGAMLIRLQLLSPKGLILSADRYNQTFSAHGIIMIFFFLIPSIPAVFGNYLLPSMLGAKSLAFPKLNLASWYIFVFSGMLVLLSLLLGGIDSGWTFYTPFTSSFSQSYVTPAIAGVLFSGFSSILSGINFMTTIHYLRAPGIKWTDLNLFVWSLYATSIIFILGTPVLAITLFLVLMEHYVHIGVIDPSYGGDPLLFQHMFWFYSHPAVYIMILPSMGVVSDVISTFSRRPVFGYKFVAASSIAIAAYGFLVWGHHMFVSGQSTFANLIFSLASFLVAVPSGIKVFNWIATLYKGRIEFSAPMIYALGFVSLFVFGGLTGLFLATLPIDVHLHDSYFVVAHFHFIMVGGAVLGLFAAIHYWWPKITHRLYNEKLAKFSAVIIIIGFFVTFLPMFILGIEGMPRRYYTYPEKYQTLNIMASLGSVVLAFGYFLPVIYLLYSLKFGCIASKNPWNSPGREWK